MKAIITGMRGFAGTHLAAFLKQKDQEPIALLLDGSRVDLCDDKAVDRALFQIRPDVIYHLAARSSVGEAWKDPDKFFEVNLKITNFLNPDVCSRA